MPITRTEITSDAQWHGLREPNIGASEIGALVGTHEYVTAYSLGARKKGLLPKIEDNDAMRRGRLLEPVAIAMLAEERPTWKLTHPRAYFCDTAARLGATPDLFVEDELRQEGIVQIKTVEAGIFARDWHNDIGEVVPPLWIAIQAMMEQHLTGRDYAYVAALVIGHALHLELVPVPFRPDVIAKLYERAGLFWELLDQGNLPPPDFGMDGATIAKVLRQDDDSELDMSSDNELPEIAAKLQAALDAASVAEEMAKEQRARLLHRIGPAARVKFQGGTISAKTVQRAEHVVRATSYRRVNLRFKKGEEVRL